MASSRGYRNIVRPAGSANVTSFAFKFAHRRRIGRLLNPASSHPGEVLALAPIGSGKHAD
jgi:hypothetical protein